MTIGAAPDWHQVGMWYLSFLSCVASLFSGAVFSQSTESQVHARAFLMRKNSHYFGAL